MHKIKHVAQKFTGKSQGTANAATTSDVYTTVKPDTLSDPTPFEDVNWLNVFLKQAWPHLSAAVVAVAKEQATATIGLYKPPIIESITVTKLELGEFPPVIEAVRVRSQRSDDEVVLDVHLEWTKGEPQVFIDIDPKYSPAICVKLKDLDIQGWFRIALKPLTATALPAFGAMLVSIQEPATTHFHVEALHGATKFLPGLDKLLDRTIKDAITDQLLWPNRIVVPILPGDYSHLEWKPSGHIVITNLRAEGLPRTDWLSKPDPVIWFYVRKVEDHIVKSSSKSNTKKPVWEETLEVPVEDPKLQQLNVQLMDEEMVGKAELVGMAIVPLDDLRPGDTVSKKIDLYPDEQYKEALDNDKSITETPHTGKSRGTVFFGMTWRPFGNAAQKAKNATPAAGQAAQAAHDKTSPKSLSGETPAGAHTQSTSPGGLASQPTNNARAGFSSPEGLVNAPHPESEVTATHTTPREKAARAGAASDATGAVAAGQPDPAATQAAAVAARKVTARVLASEATEESRPDVTRAAPESSGKESWGGGGPAASGHVRGEPAAQGSAGLSGMPGAQQHSAVRTPMAPGLGGKPSQGLIYVEGGNVVKMLPEDVAGRGA